MKQTFIVLGLEKASQYFNGEYIDKFWVYYFKPDRSDSRLFKGFTLTKLDCHGLLDFSDFEQVPGVYEFDYSIVKSQPILKNISFVEAFPIVEVQDTLLFFSAKPSEFETEEGLLKKGVNCTYIDSSGYMETSDMMGYIPSKGWCDKLNMNLFPTIPAYYSATLGHYNNRKGQAVIKIADPKFVQPFTKQASA